MVETPRFSFIQLQILREFNGVAFPFSVELCPINISATPAAVQRAVEARQQTCAPNWGNFFPLLARGKLAVFQLQIQHLLVGM